MNTQKVSKVDQQIANMNESTSTPLDFAEPKTHTQSIYWWLRESLKFSHVAAVLTTHNLEKGTDGLPVIKTARQALKNVQQIEDYKSAAEGLAARLAGTGDAPSDDMRAFLDELRGLDDSDFDDRD